MLNPDRLLHWFKGDVHAVALALQVAHVSEVWDDLIDGDRAPTSDAINRAFVAALFDIQRNPVYLRFRPLIEPIMEHAVLTWMIANRFEKSGDLNRLEFAHVLRYFGLNVCVQIARCIGGIEWAVDAAEEIFAMGSKESFADYVREHAPVH